jgi:hypothetical protein
MADRLHHHFKISYESLKKRERKRGKFPSGCARVSHLVKQGRFIDAVL